MHLAAAILALVPVVALQLAPPHANPPLLIGVAWTGVALASHAVALTLLAGIRVQRLVAIATLLAAIAGIALSAVGWRAIGSAHLLGTSAALLVSSLALLGAPRSSAIASYAQSLIAWWKQLVYAVGALAFVAGAYWIAVPTWDVGVSILMSVWCYLGAPFSVDCLARAWRERKPGWALLGLVIAYGVGSLSYEVYNSIRMGHHPITYWENLFFSVPVTIIAGTVWRADQMRPRREKGTGLITSRDN